MFCMLEHHLQTELKFRDSYFHSGVQLLFDLCDLLICFWNNWIHQEYEYVVFNWLHPDLSYPSSWILGADVIIIFMVLELLSS